jgi:nucleoside-diphosphate-sugar epimerase
VVPTVVDEPAHAAGVTATEERRSVNVFVAGATGAIGRRLVPMLVQAGHEVAGMTRSAHKADLVRAMGATPVVCNALEGRALRRAVLAARPDVVVSQLTEMPPRLDPLKHDEQFGTTRRLWAEGTANLVGAAIVAGARRVVAQSVAFAYAPDHGRLHVEEDPLYLDAFEPWVRTVEAVADLERIVTGTPGIEGIVLRYGFLYGPGTLYADDGHAARLVRERRYPIIEDGGGVASFIHVDDAARATLLALEHGQPGAYNVVDDEPAPTREWLPAYAAALGADPPVRVTIDAALAAAGPYAVYLATELDGADNAKSKRELGWHPKYPSWRVGFGATA